MASLAKSVGLAKGTLYLYFRTREEVMLALCVAHLDDWATTLDGHLRPGLSDTDVCTLLLCTAVARATFLALLMRLNVIIEHNVSIDALVAAKRAMRNRFGLLAATIARALDLRADEAMDALFALAPLLIGAAQHCHGPDLDPEALPEDVREFMDAFETERVFVPNACRIIRCIRAGH